jgi:hypothetical protein
LRAKRFIGVEVQLDRLVFFVYICFDLYLNWGILAQSRQFYYEGYLFLIRHLSNLIYSSWQTQCGDVGLFGRHAGLSDRMLGKDPRFSAK